MIPAADSIEAFVMQLHAEVVRLMVATVGFAGSG